MSDAGPAPDVEVADLEALLVALRAARSSGLADAERLDLRRVAEPGQSGRWTDELRALISGALERGIRVRDPEGGFVDVLRPAGAQDVAFCWRSGEASVAHAHAISEGCAARRPV